MGEEKEQSFIKDILWIKLQDNTLKEKNGGK